MNGKIKFYNKDKNYGFITGEDGKEYFLHASQLPSNDAPEKDENLKFDAIDSDKGKQATNVQYI